MDRMSKLGFRALAISGWITIGICIFGLFKDRPSGIAPVAAMVSLAVTWLAMPFALGAIVWKLTTSNAR